MRHIWICMIDGCLIRSGPVHTGETMPILMEKLMRILPHMSSDSIKVVCEDGRIFDSELWFSNPTESTPEKDELDTTLIAVGVVEGCVGIKVHHDKTVEEVLTSEAGSFTGRITDYVDFGVYDFSGEQLASIEDMIAMVGPDQAPPPVQPRRLKMRPRRSSRPPPRHRARAPKTRDDAPAPQNSPIAENSSSSPFPPSETSVPELRSSTATPPETQI